jgi:tRNA(Ile)-lysidine synthase
VHDPSNDNARFDRNFLRGEVLPLLGSRWPAVAGSLARHAAHGGEAQALLDELAATDGATADTLSVSQLAALPAARQRNLLRGWLRAHGVQAPSAVRLDELLRQALTAGEDRHVQLRLGPHAVRVWRGQLRLGPEILPAVPPGPLRWRLDAPLDLPGVGCLSAQAQPGLGIAAGLLGEPPTLEVRFRSEHSGGIGGKALKKRLQALDVPPWWRDRVPLLYCCGQLVQVAGGEPLSGWRAPPGAPGLRVVWQYAPF